MAQYILYTFVVVTLVKCQLNGEFWWLNSKLNSLKKVRPSLPLIDVSDFQNDDGAKIILKDEDLFTNNVLKPINDRTPKLTVHKNPDENKVTWPTNEHIKSHDVDINQILKQNVYQNHDENQIIFPTIKYIKNLESEVFTTDNNLNIGEVSISSNTKKNDDVLIIYYPKNEKPANASTHATSTEPSHSTPILHTTEFASRSVSPELHSNEIKQPHNICTYLKRLKCLQRNGIVYEYTKRLPIISNGEQVICCILPIEPTTTIPDLSHIIHFPDTIKRKRQKRSEPLENINLKQREFLLKLKFPTVQKLKPISTPQTKIVTPQEDDYIDPYWNIKNTKFQNANKPKTENTKYDDYSDDYEPEYADEIPRPGLAGLYSDHANSPSSWSGGGGNKGFSYGGSDVSYDDVDEDDYDFGYSTIDPRKAEKTQKPKLKPQKLTTTSAEVSYDAESQTINFQSNPDFQVFQGFKLLNLFRNTSRGVHDKNSNKFSNQDHSTETVIESDEDEIFDENQLFVGCGKSKKITERGNQGGKAINGSHPWLALVVLTKRRHNVLCYATLVHPRAAVTVADCVQGTAPGDISVIAGLWDSEDRTRTRNRVATVHVHPRYKPGNVDHNIAVLYWMRPLPLSANVQPACLGVPQIGDECRFFGWGGLDQGIQQAHSNWQRASIRACSGRPVVNKGAKLLSQSFCVSTSRGTVTGIGGPLICDIDGHNSIVGVVVSTDKVVLAPVRNWVMQAENLVSGD